MEHLDAVADTKEFVTSVYSISDRQYTNGVGADCCACVVCIRQGRN